MPTADLYIRVSTDEQAIRGYSQHSQEDRLVAYCRSFGIEVWQIIKEDYTAKSFNRPAWSTLMKRWRKFGKQRPDLLLFTRWDRFSRNIMDAFVMIDKLRLWGIEPRAIDQPLDFSIPENKIMLALYLATSEVENDRRSLNVKQGMYKARQEGRWMGPAPLGYINLCSPQGEKYIARKEPEATWIKKAFELVAENHLNTNVIHQLTTSWGFRCSRSNFYGILRNPVYCGKIYIPPFEKRQARLIKGKHKALISDHLYQQVQEVLNNRAIKKPVRKPRAELPLRGFLYCPLCNHKLTGSGSLSRLGKRYFYYHCHSPCGYRVRADTLNQYFLDSLSELHPGRVYKEVFKSIIEENHLSLLNKQQSEHTRISKGIENLITRNIKARDLLHQGEIEPEDYLLIKSGCKERIKQLSHELRELTEKQVKSKNKISKKVRVLLHLSKLYQKTDFITRQKIVALLLRPRAVFEMGNFHEVINTATRIIFNVRGEEKAKSTNSNPAKLEELEDPYFKKIWQSEKQHGRLLSLEDLSHCIAFLRNLYQLVT